MGVGVPVSKDLEALPMGKAEVRRNGKRIAILAFGTMVAPALAAGESLDATVVNMRFIKPLDTDLVLQLAATHDVIVTVEEGAIMGGAGSAVAETLAEAGIVMPVMHLGLPDQFIDHGDAPQLLAICGLDSVGIAAAIKQRFFKDEPKLVVNN